MLRSTGSTPGKTRGAPIEAAACFEVALQPLFEGEHRVWISGGEEAAQEHLSVGRSDSVDPSVPLYEPHRVRDTRHMPRGAVLYWDGRATGNTAGQWPSTTARATSTPNDVTDPERVGRVPWTFPVNRWPAVPRLVPALLPERRLTSARTHQSAPRCAAIRPSGRRTAASSPSTPPATPAVSSAGPAPSCPAEFAEASPLTSNGPEAASGVSTGHADVGSLGRRTDRCTAHSWLTQSALAEPARAAALPHGRAAHLTTCQLGASAAAGSAYLGKASARSANPLTTTSGSAK